MTHPSKPPFPEYIFPDNISTGQASEYSELMSAIMSDIGGQFGLCYQLLFRHENDRRANTVGCLYSMSESDVPDHKERFKVWTSYNVVQLTCMENGMFKVFDICIPDSLQNMKSFIMERYFYPRCSVLPSTFNNRSYT